MKYENDLEADMEMIACSCIFVFSFRIADLGWDTKVTFYLSFCLPEFSVQILVYQAANQLSCLWSLMSLTVNRKAELHLAAAGYKME